MEVLGARSDGGARAPWVNGIFACAFHPCAARAAPGTSRSRPGSPTTGRGMRSKSSRGPAGSQKPPGPRRGENDNASIVIFTPARPGRFLGARRPPRAFRAHTPTCGRRARTTSGGSRRRPGRAGVKSTSKNSVYPWCASPAVGSGSQNLQQSSPFFSSTHYYLPSKNLGSRAALRKPQNSSTFRYSVLQIVSQVGGHAGKVGMANQYERRPRWTRSRS